jgi:hypothetical protein
MKIRAGYRISYQCHRPTPMILVLRFHPSRAPDLILPDDPIFDPRVELGEYRNGLNRCGWVLAPAGIPRFDRSGIVARTSRPLSRR